MNLNLKTGNLILIFLTLIILGIYGCSNGSHRPTSTNQGVDSMQPIGGADTTDKPHKVSREKYAKPAPIDSKYGILGYAYPSSLVLGESKSVYVYISIIYPGSKIKDTLLNIILKDDPDNSSDSIKVTEPIRLYKYVTMNLMNTDSSIKVTNYPEVPARQQIDTLNGNKWSWGILATSADYPLSKLKLIISTEDPENYEERTIPINIKVNPHFIRKIYNFLMSDPKVLVVSILIPLITFFGGLLFGKKKK